MFDTKFLKIKKYNEQLITAGIFVLFIIWIGLFTYIVYSQEKATLYKHTDSHLLSIARGAVLILPEDFHDRTLDISSVSPQEDDYNINRLSQFAKSLNITYVYTMIRKNGYIYFTSSSATDEEYSSGNNLTRYFDRYDEASAAVKEAFQTQKIVFVEETDRWGTFRSVLVPLESPDGNLYIAGADLSVDKLHEMLTEQAFKHFLAAFGIILLAFPVLLWRLKHIKKLAFYDALTGLPNRTEFKNRAAYALQLAKRNKQPCALMFLDLDGFKEVNDTLGHSIGDELLIQVAKRLESALRKTDIPSRQGGDEFIVLLPDTHREGTAILAQKLLEMIAKPYEVHTYSLSVTFSIGIALFPQDGTDLESLSKKADIAMYRAKKEGRNCYRFSSEKL